MAICNLQATYTHVNSKLDLALCPYDLNDTHCRKFSDQLIALAVAGTNTERSTTTEGNNESGETVLLSIAIHQSSPAASTQQSQRCDEATQATVARDKAVLDALTACYLSSITSATTSNKESIERRDQLWLTVLQVLVTGDRALTQCAYANCQRVCHASIITKLIQQ